MNYLAHIFLSCDDEDLLIGNFIADSITMKELTHVPDEIYAGIELHRKIDTYTDKHAVVRKATKRLRKHHKKYSPVVIDVLYDHLLANNWERYSDLSLPDYAQEVYKVFARRKDDLPAGLQLSLPRMIENDWLNNYKTVEGLQFTLNRMDERTSFPSNFGGAIDHLHEDYDLFTEEFNAFFPDIIAYVNGHCDC